MKTVSIIMNDDHKTICGGVARFVMETAPKLCENFKVKLLVTRGSGEEPLENPNPNLEIVEIPNYRIPFTDISVPTFSKKFNYLLRESDLIFVQTLELLRPLRNSLRFRKPLVLYFHCLDWEIFPRTIGMTKLNFVLVPFIKKFTSYWYRRAAHICLPSLAFAQHLKDLEVKTPASVVPAGVDIQKFIPEKDKRKAKMRLGLDPDKPVMGFVGRFWPDKNLEVLLEIFGRVRSNYPDLTLLLVGKGYAKYERMASETPGVRWVGQQNDVVPYFQAMDVYCHPISPTETSSLATMEAMACGLPVVVNAIGCPKEYIHSGKNGYAIDPLNDIPQFLRVIEGLIENPALREKMGEEARQTIVDNFRWDQTAARLVEIFNSSMENQFQH